MPAPQSKPVTQASRLVARNAPSVAFGRGVSIQPQGQLTYDCTLIRAVCVRGSQKLLEPHRAHRQALASRRPADRPWAARNHGAPRRDERKANADIRSHQRRRHPGRGSDDVIVPPRGERDRSSTTPASRLRFGRPTGTYLAACPECGEPPQHARLKTPSGSVSSPSRTSLTRCPRRPWSRSRSPSLVEHDRERRRAYQDPSPGGAP